MVILHLTKKPIGHGTKMSTNRTINLNVIWLYIYRETCNFFEAHHRLSSITQGGLYCSELNQASYIVAKSE